MNRKWMALLMGACMVGLFAGCGQTASREGTTGITSENAERKETDSQKEKTEELQLSELAQENAFLMYVAGDCIFMAVCEDSCVYPNGIRQYDRQGNRQKGYSLGRGHVQGISEQGICYTERSQEDEEFLYMAPIETGKAGKEIILKKRKKIAKVEGWHDIYMWKSHIYYISEGDGIYHYDAGTGRIQCLRKLGAGDEAGFVRRYDSDEAPYVDDEQGIYLTVDAACYSIDREQGTMERVPGLGDKLASGEWELHEMLGGLLFVTQQKQWQQPERYICYDRRAKKERSSFTREDLQKFLRQHGFGKKEEKASADIERAYSAGGRLYLFMGLTWEEKVKAESGPRKGKKVSVHRERKFLVSCPWENIRKLRYEKEISEWIRNHQDYEQTYIDLPEEGTGRQYYAVLGRVQMWTFYGDELLISYQDQWKKEKTGVRRVGHYKLKGINLETGKMRDISEKDVIYQIFVLGKEEVKEYEVQ